MMRAAFPESYHDAASLLAEMPESTLVAGGTDVMVAVNDGSRRIAQWISLARIEDADAIDIDGPVVRLGAGVTFEQLLGAHVPGLHALAQAARTVGSPQIRATATLGGNVATASPAGDSLPVLACCDAEIELIGATGVRRVDLAKFLRGPKQTSIAPAEVIAGIHLRSTSGGQHFAKVGTRNAMVISVCSLAGRLDRANGIARLAIGSAAPTVRRMFEAEQLLLDGAPAAHVGAAVAAGAAPIDDVRSSGRYRQHALGVLGTRLATWLRADDR
ncbi:xanthine dehydrogenase family protein subunit M [soil metagenome]